jgi:hypothetical protein
MPRYGYMLDAGGRPVGVILLISTLRSVGDFQKLFANLSSWYVEPNFRSYATLLYKRATAFKEATYLNVYPDTKIRPIIEAFGFRCYSAGQLLAVPALVRDKKGLRARIVDVHSIYNSALAAAERQLLEVQSGYGCIAICCKTDGYIRPFLFAPRVVKGVIPCAQLVYCRSITDFVEVAGTVGRHLLGHGRPLVLIDANGSIAGIPGKYFADRAPKYFKGPTAPMLGDLTDTEATIFGY